MSPLNDDAGLRYVADLDGVVLRGADGVREIRAHLLGVDVERGDELHVAHMVGTEFDMHESGHLGYWIGILVVLDALDQR